MRMGYGNIHVMNHNASLQVDILHCLHFLGCHWKTCWIMIPMRTSGPKWARCPLPATSMAWVSCLRRLLTTVSDKTALTRIYCFILFIHENQTWFLFKIIHAINTSLTIKLSLMMVNLQHYCTSSGCKIVHLTLSVISRKQFNECIF